jgi:hypothetical protein
MKLKDPYAKKGLAPWAKWVIAVLAIAAIAAGLWLFNILAGLGLKSPLPRYNQPEAVVEEVVEVTDSLAVTDTALVATPVVE